MPIIKIDENTTNISKLLFFTIHLHFVILNQISTYRKLNLPLRSSIYFVFLPLEMQERLKQTKVCGAFSYFSWKGTTHKPLKVAAAKSIFSKSCKACTNNILSKKYIIGTTWFDECFSFYVVTKMLTFCESSSLLGYFFKCHVANFFEASIF